MLRLLDKQSPLLTPQLLLKPSLEAQTLQLEVPAEQGLLVLPLELRWKEGVREDLKPKLSRCFRT